jgi:hypothetical protein
MVELRLEIGEALLGEDDVFGHTIRPMFWAIWRREKPA